MIFNISFKIIISPTCMGIFKGVYFTLQVRHTKYKEVIYSPDNALSFSIYGFLRIKLHVKRLQK